MNPISFPEAAIVEVETNLTKVAASDLSEKGSKDRLFVPDRLENHSNGGKAMVALLVFTLEPPI